MAWFPNDVKQGLRIIEVGEVTLPAGSSFQPNKGKLLLYMSGYSFTVQDYDPASASWKNRGSRAWGIVPLTSDGTRIKNTDTVNHSAIYAILE